MANKLFTNAFNKTKDFIWEHTHKDAAKMLIAMGALGFVMSSLGQSFAIHINDKLDKKKKNFMLVQEASDGVVNIGLYLAITSGIWKLSDKILKHLGFVTQDTLNKVKANPKNINHVVSGGRIVTTMIASVVSCNIVTPIVRNLIAGKTRKFYEKKFQLNDNNLAATPTFKHSPEFKNLDGWAKKSISEMYKTPIYYSNTGSLKI